MIAKDSFVTMLCEPHHDAKFVCNILEEFRTTELGQLCVTDIQQVGYRHYCLRRCHESKQDERKSVRQEMHELARVLLQFRSTSTKHDLDGSNLGTEDMFTTSRFVAGVHRHLDRNWQKLA